MTTNKALKKFSITVRNLFQGRCNAGLRKQILTCGSARQVRSLASVVALTEQGRYNMERCAQVHPQHTQFALDTECNAESFWNALTPSVIAHCPVSRFGTWLVELCAGSITLDADEAAVITSWLAEQVGWSDPAYPEYAPHPLVIS
jgi:hypothetical protein